MESTSKLASSLWSLFYSSLALTLLSLTAQFVSASAVQASQITEVLFSEPIPTEDGFKVSILNYDSSLRWEIGLTTPGATLIRGTPADPILELEASCLSCSTQIENNVQADISVQVFGSTGNLIASGGVTGYSLKTPPTPTPIFGEARSLPDGFIVPILNWGEIQSNFGYQVTLSNSRLPCANAGASNCPRVGEYLYLNPAYLQVNGLDSSESATVQLTISSYGYRPKTVEFTASAGPPLNVRLATVPNVFGYSVCVYLNSIEDYQSDINYFDNGAYTYSATVTSSNQSTYVSKSVEPGACDPTLQIMEFRVGDMLNGEEATVTVKTSVSGFENGSYVSIVGRSKWFPEIDEIVQTSGGFSFNVVNYNTNYTSDLSSNIGTLSVGQPEGSIYKVTVSGLQDSEKAMVSFRISDGSFFWTTYVEGYSEGKISEALIPVLDTPLFTNDGFTVNILNYDPTFTWSFTSSVGSVVVGETLGSIQNLIIKGVNPGKSVSLQVETNKFAYYAGYKNLSLTIPLLKLPNSAKPIFDAVIPQSNGIRTRILNRDSRYTYRTSIRQGTGSYYGENSVVSDLDTNRVMTNFPAGTISFLQAIENEPGEVLNIEVCATLLNYEDSCSSTSGNSVNSLIGLVPTFDTPIAEGENITINLTNYDPSYRYSFITYGEPSQVKVTVGEPLGSVLPIRLSDYSTVLLVMTNKLGHNSASASTYAVTPQISNPISTSNGFTINVTNYKPDFTYTGICQNASVSVGLRNSEGLPFNISGLKPGQECTLVITVSNSLYGSGALGSGSATGRALTGAALTPIFSTPVSTSNGFIVNVTNYDPNFSFVPAVSSGSISIGTANGSILPLYISGLSAGASATVTVTTTRTGYETGTFAVTGSASALLTALIPTFSSPVSSSNGFTVNVTNYDPNFVFRVSVSAGRVSIGKVTGTILPLKITGLSAGQTATVTVTTTRTGYETGTASISN